MRIRVALFGVLLVAPLAAAQELEPRAYSSSPTGLNFVVGAYGSSTGDVVFDASLPFRDVHAEVNTASFGASRTFGAFGRLSSAAVVLPYAWGSVEGNVGETFRRITRSGLADLRVRLAMNLIGGPALAPREFAARKSGTTLGTSLSVVAPTGQYDPAKLINLGANRWAVKPELGLSHPHGPWAFEAYAGVWLFTANDDFFGGSRRTQQPIGAFQGHLGYTIRPRLWVARDATFYTGGRTSIDGVEKDDHQENSRYGLTASLPVGSRSSLKLAWANGFTTRVGGDFTTFSVAWQYRWLK